MSFRFTSVHWDDTTLEVFFNAISLGQLIFLSFQCLTKASDKVQESTVLWKNLFLFGTIAYWEGLENRDLELWFRCNISI